MENFVVSARKYRPATFHSVVGQSSITNTLKNAIKSNHLAQAFLFCGPRGVGKTTCARILAKTINCVNITSDTEACNECESCKSFNSGQSMNVYELDAASNNSVDDIRNLVEQVRFAPQSGKYKVYIIDEVHMLSNQAFNAFLKTLEEPPKYAIFILATTEKPKIIPTILSRCQIFDFNRIQIDDIANHLAYIAKNENITAEPEALHVIAQKADGALRDACSIFDQIVSSAGTNLTYRSVIDNLNILDYDYYFKVTDQLLKGDLSAALLTFNEILNNGFDGHLFANGLAEHFRNLLVCKDPVTVQLLEVSSTVKDRYLSQSSQSAPLFLMKGISILNQTDQSYKSSRNQRLLVELSLMQLSALTSGTGENEKKNDFSEQVGGFSATSAGVSTGATGTGAAGTGTSVSEGAGRSVQGAETGSGAVGSGTVAGAGAGGAGTGGAVGGTGAGTTTVATSTTSAPGTSRLRGSNLRTSTPSITDILNQNSQDSQQTGSNQAQSTENNGIRPNGNKALQDQEEEFTQDALELAWDNMARSVELKGKYNLFTTLGFRKPKKITNSLIEFTVDNLVQQEGIDNEKIELLGHLRKELRNFSLQLQVKTTASDAERKPYTTSDKFKEMAKKNPSLITLKQKFDLDFDL